MVSTVTIAVAVDDVIYLGKIALEIPLAFDYSCTNAFPEKDFEQIEADVMRGRIMRDEF
jgi:hypothetical protein